MIGNIVSNLVLFAMVLDPDLYGEYTSVIGCRLVFINAGCCIDLIETSWLGCSAMIRISSQRCASVGLSSTVMDQEDRNQEA